MKEYQRLLPMTVVLPASDPNITKVNDRETQITVSTVNDDDTITTDINSEHRIIKVYWDEERDTAISAQKEVVVKNNCNATPTRSNPIAARSIDTCKIEYLGDGKGNYRAFPMTTLEGYSEWCYPTEGVRYESIKARLTPHDSHHKIVSITKECKHPTIVASEDICIVRMLDDVRCGFTRYFPSIGTFNLVGRRWFLADNNASNVAWVSIIQDVKKVHLLVGTMVYLQHEIGLIGKIDIYRIDKIFYTHLLLMAHCTNQRTGLTAIAPLVQLHLPQTLRE
ncbi:hypothetical protein [Nostoc sp.]|uniref:hypothetical protein n=1 Tax=Nostoc sp. TaxID=1180 RepID=UPI002FFB5E4A